jgi:transcriptional regulator with XRE-family HTH domain
MTRKRANSSPLPIRVADLGESLQRKRRAEQLTLREAAKKTGIGASTLWRLEKGQGVPDSATLARLTQWLGVPPERFMDVSVSEARRSVVYYSGESTPDIVEAHLRADRNLSPETARALAELFRVAYNQFAEKTRKRRQ